jgi:DNA-binding MarR family transcriptional regulator
VPAPRFPDQPDFFGRVLRDAWDEYFTELSARLGNEVTPAQNRVMVLIDRAGTRPAELARRAQMTRQSMNEALRGLVDAGFVEVVDDPSHGRAKVATLTPAGWKALRRGLDAALALHDEWAALLGERKTQQLVKLLRELVDAVRAR